ncbi:TIGR03086 family protein [Candidatus Microgenomates bacterium]|nr:TIGR03086 family protein [Candidatus Microgenomates bacterium]
MNDRQLLGTFAQAVGQFDKRVKLVKQNQWHQPTPDTDWDVRELVNHLTSEQLWVPEMLAGKTIAEVGDKYEGDVLGIDPKQRWQAAQNMSLTAVKKIPLNTTVHLSFGDVAARDYLTQMFMDAVIHSWDLAAAIAKMTHLPAALAELCYEEMKKQAEAWRRGGVLGPAVKVAKHASTQDKLLALTGRNPSWKPHEAA